MNFNLKEKNPDIRYLYDLKKVLYDKKWLKSTPNFELYYMYRGLKEENDLKYNITIIPARTLGKEFVKTKGHIHLGNYGETYTVLEGEAIYLMQKTKGKIVEDVYAVMAKKGESVIIPPCYGHITINPSNLDLKTGDWSSKNCKSDYSLFEKLNGACYYYLKDDPASTGSSGEAKWIKNENYKNVPQIRFEKPLKRLPKDLSFLKINKPR